jgi:hypothetical protein
MILTELRLQQRNYGRKKFYNIGLGCSSIGFSPLVIKPFRIKFIRIVPDFRIPVKEVDEDDGRRPLRHRQTVYHRLLGSML